MSQEILYTSAPQGLKPGSRGFCTVVSSEGMAQNLADRLESLSGYRHAFPPHDERAGLNPVAYSHLIVTVGGQQMHVLSRICDAGHDYTKRSNKLAHHVALDKAEVALAPGGPAWVLADAQFCETRWNGQNGILPTGRMPRQDDCPNGTCQHWKRMTGDAGWAGVLAEATRAGDQRPVNVIFAAGESVLPLVVESMSLLDRPHRWNVTFSTYFTRLPAGLQCQWRFLLDGSREAAALRCNPHSFTIDLCAPLSRAEGADLVDLARSGASHRTQPEVLERSTPKSRRAQRVELDSESAPPLEPVGSTTATITLSKTPSDSPLASTNPNVVLTPTDEFRLPPKSRLPFILLVVCLMFLVVVGFVGSFVFGYRVGDKNARDQLAALDTFSALRDIPRSGEEDAEPPELERVAPANENETVEEPRVSNGGDAQQVKHTVLEDDGADGPDSLMPQEGEKPLTDDLPAREEPIVDKERLPPGEPFEDIRKRRFRLTLPDSNRASELAKVFVRSPSECELELLGGDRLPINGSLELGEPKLEQGHRRWPVLYRPGGLSEPSAIAEFILNDGYELSFSWKATRSQTAGRTKPSLKYCVLSLTVGAESERCMLLKPEVTEVIRRQSTDLSQFWAENHGPPPTDWFVETSFAGVPGREPFDILLTIDGRPSVEQIAEKGEGREFGELLSVRSTLIQSGKDVRLLIVPTARIPAAEEENLRIDDLSELKKTAQRSEKRTEKGITEARERVRKWNLDVDAIDEQLSEATKARRGDISKARKELIDARIKDLRMAVKKRQEEIREANGRIDQLEEENRLAVRQQAEIEGVRELVRQFGRDAKITYRVYTSVEGTEVTLGEPALK